MGNNEHQRVMDVQDSQKGKNKKLSSSRSCKEAYESIDFNNSASNKDIRELIKVACHKDAPYVDKEKLKTHLIEKVKGGANICCSNSNNQRN